MKILPLVSVVFPLFLERTVGAISNTTAGLLSSGEIALGEWSEAYEHAKTFVNGLTTGEKLEVIVGSDVESANWTALVFKDSGQTVLGYFYVTTFPVGAAVAMTWDRNLGYKQFNALAREHYGKGIQVMNAPTAEPLGRVPWGGRMAETYGPDSYLNGIFFGETTAGAVAAGVVPAGKHFLLNEQETNRSTTYSGASVSYSVDIDDKALHETYLWPFYDSVKAGLGGVMCSMNRVNETYSCENHELLTGLLKEELGFPGLVFADQGAQQTAFGSSYGGLDYGSSSIWEATVMEEGLNNGSLTTARLDDMVMRNVMGYYKAGLNNGSQPSTAGTADYVDNRGNHKDLVREIGAASMAVLKNTNNALPLKKPHSMAVFGAHAGPATGGPNTALNVNGDSDGKFYGHLAEVTGSGQGAFSYLVTPQMALTQRAIDDGTQIMWILNNTYTSGSDSMGGGAGAPGGASPGSSSNSTTSGTGSAAMPSSTGSAGGGMNSTAMGGGGAGMSSAATTEGTVSIDQFASDAEVCLVFINAYSGEGADRPDLRDDEQDGLVLSVASNCNNTIVVINASGPRLVDQWIENENVTGLVYGALLGEQSGNAIADVLYGDVNPSGRLIYTLAKNETQYEHFEICYEAVCEYTEGNYIDYKYFERYNMTPRYEFGYGQSYTTFDYSESLAVKKLNSSLSSGYATGARMVGGREDLWDEVLEVTGKISNTGDLDGYEVAQLYMSYPDAAEEPSKQLRGFERVYIKVGETENVSFKLRRRDLSVWDSAAQEWAVIPGEYVFKLGASSLDIKAEKTFTLS